MSSKSRPATASMMPGAGKRRSQGIDEVSHVAISTRIWVAFGALILLLAFTGTGMFLARGELEDARSALQQARAKGKETDVQLKNAMADKLLVIKELTAQGNRLAEFSRGEEKAKSALTAISSDAQASEKRLEDHKARLAKSEIQLRALRRENASLSTLKAELAILAGELDRTRARLEQTEAEMTRLRAAAEPYSVVAPRPGQPGQ